HAHFVERGHDVFVLVGIDLILRQRLVELVEGEGAALLGACDQLLEAGFVQVDERGIARLNRSRTITAARTVRLRHAYPQNSACSLNSESRRSVSSFSRWRCCCSSHARSSVSSASRAVASAIRASSSDRLTITSITSP